MNPVNKGAPPLNPPLSTPYPVSAPLDPDSGYTRNRGYFAPPPLAEA